MDSAFESWLTSNILTGASVADIAGAKRLLFESQTMVLAALQDSVNTPDSTSIKKVPNAERETKMRLLKNKPASLDCQKGWTREYPKEEQAAAALDKRKGCSERHSETLVKTKRRKERRQVQTACAIPYFQVGWHCIQSRGGAYLLWIQFGGRLLRSC